MIRREPDRARAFSHDRPYKLKRERDMDKPAARRVKDPAAPPESEDKG